MHAADQWRKIEDIFYAALELDPAARPAFLEQQCGSDAELRKEVESLLASSDKPIDFAPQAVVEVAQ
jgi:hypothetical protein